MLVNFSENKAFKIRFSHGSADYVVPGSGEQVTRPVTVCEFSVINNGKMDTVYYPVFLFYKDTPNKSKARKYSLTGVMNTLNLTKEERSVIWQEYFKTHKVS